MTPVRFSRAQGMLCGLVAGFALAISGCGESVEEGMVTQSEEHKAATNAMADFMKSKGKKHASPAPTPPPAAEPETKPAE